MPQTDYFESRSETSYDQSPDFPPPIRTIYRDERDVRLTFHLALGLTISLLNSFCWMGACFYLYQRRPDRIVVDMSSGRVVTIDNRQYGKTDGVEFTQDRPTDLDKINLADEFCRLLHEIDANPPKRKQDLKKALSYMLPKSREDYVKYLDANGLLAVQRQEAQQAVWTVQQKNLDPNDSHLVHIIGTQDISKNIDGQLVHETQQMNLWVKVVTDTRFDPTRNPANFNTGFLVGEFGFDEIPKPSEKR